MLVMIAGIGFALLANIYPELADEPVATRSRKPVTPTVSVVSYTTTLELSAGTVLPVTCNKILALPISPHCEARLPNGNSFSADMPLRWSSDLRYAVVCIGDRIQPCSAFQVWDMIAGRMLQLFAYYDHVQWLPEREHELLYYDYSSDSDQVFYVWDVSSHSEPQLQSCRPGSSLNEIAQSLCNQARKATAVP
jgi:hypothetical protein